LPKDIEMEMRVFGRTGIKVSILGFGCGAVGGLMVRGAPVDQERTIGRALDAGVNYFDTAVQYGSGESERNLGRALKALNANSVLIGTKIGLQSNEMSSIEEAIGRSLEGSLQRLGRECVDIFHLHNPITEAGGGEAISARQVLDEVAPTFDKLRRQGKLRYLGITAIGETAALEQIIDSRLFDAAQIVYSMLNPSAARRLPPDYPAQDYGQLFRHTQAHGVGVIGIRVLAGGALSGSAERHPVASPAPTPIGSASSYEADLARARRLLPLVHEGFARSLAEAATRYAISHSAMGTILVGMATPEQFDAALAAVEKGPLPQPALDRIVTLQEGFAGEAR
jgi:aryl-alcohol dehydrogenase-like predicted oxidoreductase